MKIYTNESVYDAALRRIEWLFDEFDNVCVNFSGGKDSTVTLHLALKVAERRGRLPLPVIFIDQEAEFQATVRYVETVMADPRIKPLWFQTPMRMTNNAGADNAWITCWGPGEKWCRPQHPLSIKGDPFNTPRFYDMFDLATQYAFPGQRVVKLAGVRAEESPARLKGLTSYETYGGETWGKKEDEKAGRFTMYPIYDWSYSDVWKMIHDEGIAYCEIYDYMYQYGVPLRNMRVSSLFHETALPSLFYLQEVEPETWAAVTERLEGLQAVAQLKKSFMAPRELPYMFKDWYEYRDHLLENLISDEAQREIYAKNFSRWCSRYEEPAQKDLLRAQIKTILTDDRDMQALSTFAASHGQYSINRGSKGGDASERTADL